MKYKFLIILLIPLFITQFVIAQEQTDEAETSPEVTKTNATPTKEPTDKIQELKDKVASRVAALKKETISGITGLLKSTSDSALILTQEGNDYSIQVDEDTKIYSVDTGLKKKEIKLSTITKDTLVSAIGAINNEDKSGTARVIIVKEPNVAIFGKVTAVSTKDGTITITANDGQTYTADIETTTKINSFDPVKNTISKLGLSKIEQDMRIHVYAVKGKAENQLTALRILLLPKDITKVEPPTPTVEATAKPTPTVKATASPKLTPTKTPTPTKTQ